MSTVVDLWWWWNLKERDFETSAAPRLGDRTSGRRPAGRFSSLIKYRNFAEQTQGDGQFVGGKRRGGLRRRHSVSANDSRLPFGAKSMKILLKYPPETSKTLEGDLTCALCRSPV